jgi:hypothetical protein
VKNNYTKNSNHNEILEFFMKEEAQPKEEEERPEWAWLMKRMTKET